MTIATTPTIRRITNPRVEPLSSSATRVPVSPAAAFRFGLVGGSACLVALGAVRRGPIAKESAGAAVVGGDRDGRAGIGDRAVEIALVLVDEDAAVQRLGALRIDPDRLRIIGERAVEIPLVAIRVGALLERPVVVRIEADQGAVVPNHPVVVAPDGVDPP